MRNLTVPREGDGLHDFILRQSRDLLVAGYSPEQVIKKLVALTNQSDRTTQDIDGEIENAVLGAKEFLDSNPSFVHRPCVNVRKKWVDPNSFEKPMFIGERVSKLGWKLPIDEELIRKVLAKQANLTLETDTEGDIVDLFARINFDICAGRETYKPIIKPINQWKDLSKQQFVVCNPFRDRTNREDFSIKFRLYLVVEFDSGTKNEQIRLLHYIQKAGFLLAMIVFSGHKSYHGWYTCYGRRTAHIQKFCRLATSLGADTTTRAPSQWVRMPNGWNYKYNVRQNVIYINNEVIEEQNELVRSTAL